MSTVRERYAVGGAIGRGLDESLLIFGESAFNAARAMKLMSRTLYRIKAEMRRIRKETAIIARQNKRADVEFYRRKPLIHNGRKS